MSEDQETGKVKPEEMLSDEQRMALKTEIKQPAEKTRESEIQANVDFWSKLGVEVDEQEVREAIEALPEVEGFGWYFYVPKGLKLSDLWSNMAERYKDLTPKEMDVFGNNVVQDIEFLSKAPIEESYAVSARYSQEPDKNSMGENQKTSLEWAEISKTEGRTYMSILELGIADLRWNEENGDHLTGNTGCPARRNPKHDPYQLSVDNDGFVISYLNPGFKGSVREVITKDTSSEAIEALKQESESK